MEKELLEYIKYGAWILFGSGLLFEFAPIKIKPASAILGWVGKRLNKDVKDDISKLQSKVETVQKDLQEHTVESHRREILNFASELRCGTKKTEEHFNYIMTLHDRYEKYTETNQIKNSQADLAFKIIKEKYKECWDNDDFL